MKQFHLYKIDKIYLYVLQTIDDKNNIDILAIRNDVPYIIFPMYSSTFKKYKDLGIPSVDTLNAIDPYFLTCIQVSQIVCENMFNLTTNNIREYIKENILNINLCNRANRNRDIDLLIMSINRSQLLNLEELQKYVTDRVFNSNNSKIYKKN